MSTVTCHDRTCPAYGVTREMKLASVVTKADGTTIKIWEEGVYCVCMRKLHDVQHGEIS